MTLTEWLDSQGTQADLARETGMSWRTIHRIVVGERIPSGRTALAISDATGGAVSVRAVIEHARAARHERESI